MISLCASLREGLSSRAQPTVTPKAAYDDVDDTWMDAIEQMQLSSSSLKPTTLSGEEKVCLSNVVEQYCLELLRQAEPNNENIHLSLCGGMGADVFVMRNLAPSSRKQY